MFTIAVCGQVSSGKTSFVNAIVGCPVGTTSILRETFQPIAYELDCNANIDVSHLQSMYEENKRRRENGEWKALPSTIGVINRYDLPLTIIDLPGVNDAADGDGKFTKMLQDTVSGKVDMVIYVTPASSAFTLASEVDLFGKIKGLVQEENDKGHLVRIAVVITKFDDKDDSELDLIATEAHKKIGDVRTFRFSNHLYLAHMLSSYEVSLQLPNYMRQEMRKILVVAGMSNKRAASEVSKDVTDFRCVPQCDSGDWDDLVIHIVDEYRGKRKKEAKFALSYMKKNMPGRVEYRMVDKLRRVLSVLQEYHCLDRTDILPLVETYSPPLACWLVTKVFTSVNLNTPGVDRLLDILCDEDKKSGTRYETVMMASFVSRQDYSPENHADGIRGRCNRLLSDFVLWSKSTRSVVDHTSDNCSSSLAMENVCHALLEYHPTARYLGELAGATYRELCEMDILGTIRWDEIKDYNQGIWLGLKLRLRDSTFFREGHSGKTLDHLVFEPAR